MSKLQNTDCKDMHADEVRRANLPDIPLEKMSELGRDLVKLSREYEDAGEELLSEEEIEVELARRRGGCTQKDAA